MNGMTIKQWHAEKAKRSNSDLKRITEVVVPYDATSPTTTKQIMELLMETLSDRQSRVLQHLEARYGSAIRQTVEHTLSEFMTGMTSGQNIADRMKNYDHTYHTLLQAGVTSSLDRMHVMALMATIAHGGRIDFRLTQGHKGDFAVRVRPRKEETG